MRVFSYSIMQNNKVFMIGWEYPPHNSGGLGVACEGMTQALAEHNTKIYFTLPYKLPQLGHMQVLDCSDPLWAEDGALYVPPFGAYDLTRPKPTVTGEVVSVTSLDVLPQSELEGKVDRYAELVTENGAKLASKMDVIHAHDWMSFPAAMQLSQKTGKPYIAHIHSTELDRIPSGSGSSYIMNTEYQGMQHATRVVAVSYYTKQVLVNKYGIDPSKIDVVHNGISPLPSTSLRSLPFAGDRPVVVFMGRLTMQKGAEYFLRLAAQVLKRVPDALFIVAGNGDMYQELLLSSAHEQLSASVLFTGFVRDRQRNRLLDRADVFVMPSLSEPFGLVAMEAAQRRTPVIVSQNSGVRELLKSCITVDFWDVDKMTNSIVMLIQNRDVSARQIEAQLSEVNRATWDRSAIRLQQVYRKAFLG